MSEAQETLAAPRPGRLQVAGTLNSWTTATVALVLTRVMLGATHAATTSVGRPLSFLVGVGIVVSLAFVVRGLLRDDQATTGQRVAGWLVIAVAVLTLLAPLVLGIMLVLQVQST